MTITEKLKYAQIFLEITNKDSNYKCEDIAVLEDHVVYKLRHNDGSLKISKHSIAEILNSVQSLDEHVYCTNCIYGMSLINSIEDDSLPIPSSCETCYPYDVEDSTPFKERPNYIPLT